MPRFLQRLKGVDFYRKIPSDLTESTVAGAALSIAAALSIVLLLGMELNAFLTPDLESQMVVDRSSHGELLRINFNLSFPSLPCEFASLDVSDSLGTKKINLTKTVRKLPITAELERAGNYVYDDRQLDIKYDDPFENDTFVTDYSAPLTHENFKKTLDRYPIVVVNFFAPWCPWCQRLEPTWEAVTQEVHRRYPEKDGRLRFARVDCVAEVELCREHHISGFPSLRVFRKGSDDISVYGHKDHEAYRGDRTKEALLDFAENLIPNAGQPHYYIRGVTRVAKTSGCALSGFVLVKKVPGTLHVLAKSPGHSFDHQAMNLSHVVNYLYFGTKPSPRWRKTLQVMHPLGLTDDWADKLANQKFFSPNARATFEHYMQVVLTTMEPLQHTNEHQFHAYEYTVHSHTYNTDDIPSAKFSYDMSPIQIVVRESRKAFYHFVTTLCAIIGGIFTVAGIVDGVFHTSVKLAKKVELGKQT